MESDWEVEVGGGAPVIEARWAGFVDLRENPERMTEIAEAVSFPALGGLLLALNGAESPVWTAKCDLWEPEQEALGGTADAGVNAALACYVDVLPRDGEVFTTLEQAEGFCRNWVGRLRDAPGLRGRVELIVRQAFAGEAEGFAISAYLTGAGADRAAAAVALRLAMPALAGTIPPAAPAH
jgi:hypothetical protein